MPIPSWFPKTHASVCPIILAGTPGARLFPMTSTQTPKHLLPIAGIPAIIRLLDTLDKCPELFVAIAAGDTSTVDVIQSACQEVISKKQDQWVFKKTKHINDNDSNSKESYQQTIIIIMLDDECFGSTDALRYIEKLKLIDESCHVMIVPGDLVALQPHAMNELLRPFQASACTALLVDVGEKDDNGTPLKESAKSKKGLFARDEEDIEYIGLSYPSTSLQQHQQKQKQRQVSLPRIICKQSKLDVEADEDMTGNPASLDIPKERLRYGRVTIRTDWNDVHVYVLAPWVRQLIVCRKNLVSIQGDLIPLLVSRQFRGKLSTFGSNVDSDSSDIPTFETNNGTDYTVLAHVVPGKTFLRVNTISSLIYACKEVVATASAASSDNNEDVLLLPTPKDSKLNAKFQSLVLDGTKLGDKITMKSTTVGKNCQLGSKCRLNNVIIMEGAIVGDNCSLQNTLIGPGAVLGNNCSLTDCQVGPRKQIAAGTKEKGETFAADDETIGDDEEMPL